MRESELTANRAEYDRLYRTWEAARKAEDAHEDRLWGLSLQPDGSYVEHPGQGIDLEWIAEHKRLQAAVEKANTERLDFLYAHRGSLK